MFAISAICRRSVDKLWFFLRKSDCMFSRLLRMNANFDEILEESDGIMKKASTKTDVRSLIGKFNLKPPTKNDSPSIFTHSRGVPHTFGPLQPP